MRKATGTMVATVGCMAALAVTLTAAPASADNVRRYHLHEFKQGYGIVGQYWKKPGASRRLNLVQAHKSPVSKSGTYYARWVYKKPGAGFKVGKSWRKAKVERNSGGTYGARTWWGDSASNTGPKFPKGTVICIHYRGSSWSQKVCDTMSA